MTDTVLVVDDDAGIRELLKFRLEKNGFAVETHANGQACIEYLRSKPLPSLVLLDVRMPRIDGVEVLETIREEFSSELPVVLLTGTRPPRDAVEATDYIDKPFTMNEVVACVERVLGE